MGPKRKDTKQSMGGWVKSDFNNSFPDARREDIRGNLNSGDLQYPKTSSQLVIQKKKIEEVKQWLETALLHKKKASILLLKGPPGSGKTVTLNLLASELNAEICSWEEPVRALSAQEWDYKQWCNRGIAMIPDKNPMQHLEDFMKKHNKYCKLQIGYKNASEKIPAKKVVVLKNIYSVISNNLDFCQYYNHGSVPLVFIWTEENNDFYHLSQAFPSDLQASVQLATIQFNKVADTFVMKALQFATAGISQFPKSSFQEVIDSCNGDLQFAFNTLKLIMKGVGKEPVAQTSRRLGVKRSREKTSTLSSRYSSKDHSCEFMHLLGKVLYAKRISSEDTVILAAHLREEERQPLKDNPFTLVEQINQPAPKVALYLHQNFCNTFSCIDDISKATHYLSSADRLSSESLENEKLEEFSLFVAILGTMHSHVNSKPSSWLPLKKPEYYNLRDRKHEFKLGALKNQLSTSLENEYAVEIFPYLKLILPEDMEGSSQKKRCAPTLLSSNSYEPHRRPTNPIQVREKDQAQEEVEEDEIVIEEFDD